MLYGNVKIWCSIQDETFIEKWNLVGLLDKLFKHDIWYGILSAFLMFLSQDKNSYPCAWET